MFPKICIVLIDLIPENVDSDLRGQWNQRKGVLRYMYQAALE